MGTFGRIALAALVGVGVGDPGFAAPADPEHGERLARHWCAACHVVSDDQARGSDNVPTFSAIAQKPGFDAAAIARFLSDPHPKMPDMQISRPEAADLGAYIASLKK